MKYTDVKISKEFSIFLHENDKIIMNAFNILKTPLEPGPITILIVMGPQVNKVHHQYLRYGIYKILLDGFGRDCPKSLI